MPRAPNHRHRVRFAAKCDAIIEGWETYGKATVHNHNYWNITRLPNICFSWTADVSLTFLFIKKWSMEWKHLLVIWGRGAPGKAGFSVENVPAFVPVYTTLQSFSIWKQKASNSSHQVMNEMQRSGGKTKTSHVTPLRDLITLFSKCGRTIFSFFSLQYWDVSYHPSLHIYVKILTQLK